MSHTVIRDLFGAAQLAMQKPNMQNDQSDLDNSPQNSQQQGPQMPGEVASAPYIKMLTKLGYEYQGSDEDLGGGQIGSSFAGQEGDTIYIKPDGTWSRFGPGATRSQGKSTQDLGNNLIRDTLQQGDDTNHHHALRQSGYQKIHKDKDGNQYYKHPQTGKTVHVTKDGRWGSSVGTGRGAGKLRDFLGNEQMENEDPLVQQTKLKQQELKQKGQQLKQGQGPGGKTTNGTRGGGGTRAGARFGGRGGF